MSSPARIRLRLDGRPAVVAMTVLLVAAVVAPGGGSADATTGGRGAPAPLGAATTGPSGPTGGPSGPTGATATTGPTAPTGVTAATGPTTPTGPSPPAGPTGPSAPAGPSGPTGATGPTGPLVVAFDHRRLGPPIAPRFLGLSFEVSSLPLIARYAEHGDFVTLLRSLGPGVLRFGGISADSTAWAGSRPQGPLVPATTLSRTDLRLLGVLARRSGWQVILTVDLARGNPDEAASEVALASRVLGRSLAGVELGNEPNAYGTHGLRPLPWGFPQYAAEVGVFWSRIKAAAPSVRLAGPDVSGSGGGAIAQWVQPEATLERPALLTGHYYSLGCGDASAPTIDRLLSQPSRERLQAALNRYLTVSAAASIPFRLDEAGSVSCGGRPGVSDTFASALWNVELLVRAMAGGAAGVNLHGHLESCEGYSPLCATSSAGLLGGALAPRPGWYALLFARSLVGDRPLRTLTAAGGPDVDVEAFQRADGDLQVVIVDTAAPGSAPAPVRLLTAGHLPWVSAVRLTAGSLAATTGVRVGGRVVATDGTWRAPRVPLTDAGRARALALEVPAGSATLLTLARRR
jgi:hypothetical protein